MDFPSDVRTWVRTLARAGLLRAQCRGYESSVRGIIPAEQERSRMNQTVQSGVPLQTFHWPLTRGFYVARGGARATGEHYALSEFDRLHSAADQFRGSRN